MLFDSSKLSFKHRNIRHDVANIDIIHCVE